MTGPRRCRPSGAAGWRATEQPFRASEDPFSLSDAVDSLCCCRVANSRGARVSVLLQNEQANMAVTASDLGQTQSAGVWRSCFPSFSHDMAPQESCPRDPEHFWMGHADEEVGDIYSKLKEDVKSRQEVTKRIDLGFELPVEKPIVGPNGPKIGVEAVQEVVVTV